MKMQWTLIFALLFALLTAIFAVVNVAPVRVNYVFGFADIPLILVILGSTLLGGLIVGLFGIIRQYKLQRRIRQLEQQLKSSPEEAVQPAESVPAEPVHETEAEPTGAAHSSDEESVPK